MTDNPVSSSASEPFVSNAPQGGSAAGSRPRRPTEVTNDLFEPLPDEKSKIHSLSSIPQLKEGGSVSEFLQEFTQYAKDMKFYELMTGNTDPFIKSDGSYLDVNTSAELAQIKLIYDKDAKLFTNLKKGLPASVKESLSHIDNTKDPESDRLFGRELWQAFNDTFDRKDAESVTRDVESLFLSYKTGHQTVAEYLADRKRKETRIQKADIDWNLMMLLVTINSMVSPIFETTRRALLESGIESIRALGFPGIKTKFELAESRAHANGLKDQVGVSSGKQKKSNSNAAQSSYTVDKTRDACLNCGKFDHNRYWLCPQPLKPEFQAKKLKYEQSKAAKKQSAINTQQNTMAQAANVTQQAASSALAAIQKIQSLFGGLSPVDNSDPVVSTKSSKKKKSKKGKKITFYSAISSSTNTHQAEHTSLMRTLVSVSTRAFIMLSLLTLSIVSAIWFATMMNDGGSSTLNSEALQLMIQSQHEATSTSFFSALTTVPLSLWDMAWWCSLYVLSLCLCVYLLTPYMGIIDCKGECKCSDDTICNNFIRTNYLYSSTSPSSKREKRTIAKLRALQADYRRNVFEFLLDSGTNSHISSPNMPINLHENARFAPVSTAGGDTMPIGIGWANGKLIGNSEKDFEVSLQDITVLPNVERNLLSVSKLALAGYCSLFHATGAYIFDPNMNVILTAELVDNLYSLRFKVDDQDSNDAEVNGGKIPAAISAHKSNNRSIDDSSDCSTYSEDELDSTDDHDDSHYGGFTRIFAGSAASLWTWHRRLGHISVRAIKWLAKTCGFKITDPQPGDGDPSKCVDCAIANCKRKAHPSIRNRSNSKLHGIHFDLDHVSRRDVEGYRYNLLMVDDATRYKVSVPLKLKNDTMPAIVQFIRASERRSGLKVKFVRCDRGTEFKPLRQWCKKRGISFETAGTGEHFQNPVAERGHQTIQSLARAMMTTANWPRNRWTHAYSYATEVANRTKATPDSDVTPWEHWHERPVDHNRLKTFGCLVIARVRVKGRDKGPKIHNCGIECVFVGLHPESKTYKLLRLDTMKPYDDYNAEFFEYRFPFRPASSPQSAEIDELAEDSPDAIVSDSDDYDSEYELGGESDSSSSDNESSSSDNGDSESESSSSDDGDSESDTDSDGISSESEDSSEDSNSGGDNSYSSDSESAHPPRRRSTREWKPSLKCLENLASYTARVPFSRTTEAPIMRAICCSWL